MASQRKALIIANDTYEHQALQNLRAPAADAKALERVLGDPEVGGFDVQVTHNEPAHVIRERVESLFRSAQPGDVLLVHFSCHGLKDESGDLYFAAANTLPNMLGSTTVPAEFVQRYMERSRSRDVVLLLDCCYGGAFPAGATVRAAGDVDLLESFPQETPGTGRSRVVITATTSMQFALEGDHLVDDHLARPSVFTAAVVQGLASGEADLDEDGWVSVRELYDYVREKVHKQNPNQTPTTSGDLAGLLRLAKSRRRRIRPAPISSKLREAIASDDRLTRLGAVGELKMMLVGEDLPEAAAAYAELRKLIGDDSRGVADSAAEALQGATIQPATFRVDFGRVGQKSVPPHQTVQLSGPPIARACTPHPSHAWIHIAQEADRLDISIDTSNTGALHGTIVLRGPSGEAEITIDAEVFAPRRHPMRSRPPREPTDDQARVSRTGAGKPGRVPVMGANPVLGQDVISRQSSTSPREGRFQLKKFRVSRNIQKTGIAAVALLAIGVLVWIIVPGRPGNVYSGTNYSGGNYKFDRPQGIAADSTHVWVANYSGNSVTELNPSNGSWTQTLSGSKYQFSEPQAITDDGTHVWVANYYGNSVTELNASNGSWIRTITGGNYNFDSPQAIAADGTRVWVANYNGNSVTELNASNGSWIQTLSGSNYQFIAPQGINADGTQVWVANAGGDSVTGLNAG